MLKEKCQTLLKNALSLNPKNLQIIFDLTYPLLHPELSESGRCSKQRLPQDITPEKISVERGEQRKDNNG